MVDDPPAEAIHRLPTPKHATVSPDGSRVACYYTGSGSEVHVLDLASGELSRWTDGEAGVTTIWPLVWDADGERVLFHRDDADGAEARIMRDRLVDLGHAVGPDGTVEYHELDESGHWGAVDGVPKPLTLTDEFLDRRL